MASEIYRHTPCWTGEIIVTTHVRIAAGVCALSIGLLVGGSGAVALADGTEAGGSPIVSQDGTVSGGQGTPSTEGPTSTIGNQRVDQEPGQDVTKPTASADSPTGGQGQGPTSTVEAQTYSTDEHEGTGTGGSNSGGEAGITPSTESNTSPPESAAPASESNVRPAGTDCACIRCEPARTGADRSGRTGAPRRRPRL